MISNLVIGLDFGSDSVRCLIIDTKGGDEIASATAPYGRWSSGLFCSPENNSYRQHPLDHIEAMEKCIREAIGLCPDGTAERICGIGYDTTASTPVLTDINGTPLALLEKYSDNPDAMFVLWKDHTAIKEAEEINTAAHSSDTDYTRYCGGSYSCEWVWAKMLHCLRNDRKISEDAYSWTEHCDWIGGILTGNTSPQTMFRGRCTAGHKAMWNAEWGGLPPMEFFTGIDPLYSVFNGHLYSSTVTAGQKIGGLCREWAARLGLRPGIAVAMGAIDCHAGAVGVGIVPGTLVKVMGTSTCDIAVARPEVSAGRIAQGICGQVDGSVLPGMTGYEAGQSAFGDVYAWFRRIMEWPLQFMTEAERVKASARILEQLNTEVAKIGACIDDPVALDWLNGRRTPDLDPNLKGGIYGITLGSTAPMMFKSFVEATAFGARAINERFEREGVDIGKIIAVGGISQKSPYVMQVLADVLGTEIAVADSEQSCALGSGIFAAVASGTYSSIPEAQENMKSSCSMKYSPDTERKKIYDVLYGKYRILGKSAY